MFKISTEYVLKSMTNINTSNMLSTLIQKISCYTNHYAMKKVCKFLWGTTEKWACVYELWRLGKFFKERLTIKGDWKFRGGRTILRYLTIFWAVRR